MLRHHPPFEIPYFPQYTCIHKKTPLPHFTLFNFQENNYTEYVYLCCPHENVAKRNYNSYACLQEWKKKNKIDL